MILAYILGSLGCVVYVLCSGMMLSALKFNIQEHRWGAIALASPVIVLWFAAPAIIVVVTGLTPEALPMSVGQGLTRTDRNNLTHGNKSEVRTALAGWGASIVIAVRFRDCPQVPEHSRIRSDKLQVT